ncbi:Ribosomal protein S18 acetylase RimI [Bacillus sp. OV166]|uniref:GNAT family N-acetyltransferase n=1 Tax=Bacillaceae TaxID=186817 RepID=UPI000A2ABFF8|nr:GNAT family N-acetyltransferase [Bacillus sp. OV166]SMQ84620.1 Ribosomal protein S18 acetylase RimI [Bacillus sp. OV166]
MLDKSIPYFNVIMKRGSGAPVSCFSLPKGYSFVWFSEGKEMKWAEIETSVGEFTNIDEAMKYFQENYLPFLDELKRRLLFVQNERGEEVGTITSWWNMTGTKRVPSIHWFAVNEEYQGCGLGKALVSESLKKLILLEGDKDVFLHTQTWSYKAIGLYLKSGFEILSSGSFSHYKNEYFLAMPHLRKFLKI